MKDTWISPEHWCGWHLDPDDLSLNFENDEVCNYKLDLDRLLTSDDLVFWFVQIGRKDWPGAQKGFAAAVDAILDPHQQINTLRQTSINEPRPERSYTPDQIRERVANFIAKRTADQEQRDAWDRASANFN